ncbi:N-formylglutamate amidohydrolase [Marinomonas sp.]|nr:N-formylglutamate amidohydrolase [Marinomonas sp.]MDB4838033.1 N-formylglutamate amidohydrolase [Marinomonas sp.]
MSLNNVCEPCLLSQNDPQPIEVINPESHYPVVLVCEHAGNLVPLSLQNLGLSQSTLKQHIAWDLGAKETAKLIAERLGATLVIQRYSRLVIDCNRPPQSDSAILSMSDGMPIEANVGLSDTEKLQRINEIFEPFQQVVQDKISRPSCKVAISIHSFTRTMSGAKRPWDIAFLYRNDQLTSGELARDISGSIPKERIGMNEPYQITDDEDWFVIKQGEASGKFHSLIEICNDQIDTENGQQEWAALLAASIERTMKRITE